MSKIILTVGISASGKSTYAKSIIAVGNNTVRCNRDEIRKSLFGYTDEDISFYYQAKGLNKREEMVSMVSDGIIKAAIRHGKDVIVDNTHLKLKYLEVYKKYGVPIEYKLFDVDTNECISRDNNRTAKVSESVIKRQAKQLAELKRNFDFQTWFPENYTGNHTKIDERVLWDKGNTYNPLLPECIIVDLDGTLALLNGRSPYEGEKCLSDKVNGAVDDLLDQYSGSGVEVIIFSGRNSDKGSFEATKEWLKNKSINYQLLYMRKEGDMRADTIVKREMYDKYVAGKFNVLFVLDDRDCVVHEVWRKMKIHCFQVHDGNF